MCAIIALIFGILLSIAFLTSGSIWAWVVFGLLASLAVLIVYSNVYEHITDKSLPLSVDNAIQMYAYIAVVAIIIAFVIGLLQILAHGY